MNALKPEEIELIERFARDQVTEKEAQFVRELIQSRPECREYHDFALHLGRTLGQGSVEPPVWMKGKVMDRISESKGPTLLLRWAPAAALTAAMLLVGFIVGKNWVPIQQALVHAFAPGTFLGSLLGK